MLVKIADITVPERARKDMGDLTGLAASMRRLKQLQAIGITPARELVFGQRRLEAAKLNGWDEIEARVIDLDNPLEAERDENECRKEFTPSERVAIARAIEERAGERRGRPAAEGGQPATNTDAPPPGEKTRDFAAKQAGFKSTTAYRRAAAVVDEGAPELVAAVDSGDVSLGAAAEVAKLPKDEQAATVAAGPEAVKDRAAEERERRKVVETRPMPHETKPRRGKPAVKGVGGEASAWPLFDQAYGRLVRAVDDYARTTAQMNGRSHREAQDICGKLLQHMKKWDERVTAGGRGKSA